ncbi:MAG: metallophosphoesterase family protein [Streptomycetales bacterium]
MTAAAVGGFNVTGVQAQEEPLATFVSTSGIPHADIANVKQIRQGRGWDPGDPNSTNASWESAVSAAWSQVASEGPDAVFVTGDQVEGAWGKDVDRTGIFGPVNTLDNQKKAVTNAGNAYYGEQKRDYNAAGLKVYPAPGDHEFGGMNHEGFIPNTKQSYKLLPSAKAVWARNFTANGTKYAQRPVGTNFKGTAYAAKLPGSVLLISLDPIARWSDGTHARISSDQLSWVARVIEATTAEHVFVQVEIPPKLGTHWSHSSSTVLENGDKLWQVMDRHNKADLLLAAEFHEINAVLAPGHDIGDPGAPVEIIHGGRLQTPSMNYLVIQIFADRIEITAKRVTTTVVDDSRELWQTSLKRPPLKILVSPVTETAGNLTMTNTGRVTEHNGALSLQP